MSKNIKIDSKNATVAEIENAIERLEELKTVKANQENMKVAEKFAKKFNGKWVVEHKDDKIRFFRIVKITKVEYTLFDGPKLSASVDRVVGLGKSGVTLVLTNLQLAADPSGAPVENLQFYDRRVSVTANRTVKNKLDEIKADIATQIDIISKE